MVVALQQLVDLQFRRPIKQHTVYIQVYAPVLKALIFTGAASSSRM